MKISFFIRASFTAVALIVLTCMSAVEVNAETAKHEIDKLVDAMMDKDPSTAGMIAAAEEGEKKWDAELNKYYRLLSENFDKETRAALKKAQLAWIAFRDAEFALIAAAYSKKEGTMYRVIAAGARLEVVKKRALELKLLYEEHFSEK
ncbi:MAG TPA: DUF1311 domain-containing protein [Candidatus Wallbacteria bacterium]|nr:DUF1311 domain-containing protein [Candidatus Wallbacteria bacterium]